MVLTLTGSGDGPERYKMVHYYERYKEFIDCTNNLEYSTLRINVMWSGSKLLCTLHCFLQRQLETKVYSVVVTKYAYNLSFLRRMDDSI